MGIVMNVPMQSAIPFQNSLEVKNSLLLCSMDDRRPTQAGGGGVGKSLYKNLEELNLCLPGDGYSMGFYTLHCLQLTLANAILIMLGKGGKKNEKEYCCTALQMMHGVYSLQKHHEPSEWKKIWVWAAIQIGKITSEPKKVPAPILT
jgi:hypothetical protein